MLTEPHVDLNFQCQMHPSYLSNPSDLSPCLEQKLVAQLHTQCAPEILLCFCGNHGAIGSQPEWLQTIERNIGWMLVDAMEP